MNSAQPIKTLRDALLEIKRQLDETMGRSTYNAYSVIDTALVDTEKAAESEAQTVADASRLEKLLSMCTECRVKFGPGNKARQLTMTIKNSVETSVGYRAELRKTIDELESTFKESS